MTKQQNQKRMNAESERMFYEGRHLFTTHSNAVGARITAEEYVEGADVTSNYLLPAFTRSAEDQKKLFFNPYDEVKAVNGLLRKDRKYNHGSETGTLPFEIFINWTDHPTTKYPYAGWILALFNPDLYSQIKKDHNAPDKVQTPTTLAFFLYDGDYRNQGSEKPFACIAFEDIERLRTRITECIPSDWDITNWNIPPLSDTEYWKRHIDFDNNGFSTEGAWNPANGGMIQNCWHIPLRRLLDIATVTMIGESDPMIGAWTAEQYDLQKERLEYIKSYAWGIDQNMNWKERRITEDQIRRDLEEAHGRTRFKWGELFYTDIREFRRAQADCLRKRTRNQIVLCTP